MTCFEDGNDTSGERIKGLRVQQPEDRPHERKNRETLDTKHLSETRWLLGNTNTKEPKIYV